MLEIKFFELFEIDFKNLFNGVEQNLLKAVLNRFPNSKLTRYRISRFKKKTNFPDAQELYELSVVCGKSPNEFLGLEWDVVAPKEKEDYEAKIKTLQEKNKSLEKQVSDVKELYFQDVLEIKKKLNLIT